MYGPALSCLEHPLSTFIFPLPCSSPLCAPWRACHSNMLSKRAHPCQCSMVPGALPSLWGVLSYGTPFAAYSDTIKYHQQNLLAFHLHDTHVLDLPCVTATACNNAYPDPPITPLPRKLSWPLQGIHGAAAGDCSQLVPTSSSALN